MAQYIDKSALVAEIKKLINEIYAGRPFDYLSSEQQTALWYVKSIMSSIDTLEVKEVDLDKQAEWIANGIMISVQSAKLHTNVYNPDRKDYDHSHLMMAARRGIDLGLKIA